MKGPGGVVERKWHPTITPQRIQDAVLRRRCSLDDPGFCLACGYEVSGVEPDAREYECEVCGEPQVFGCEELLMELPL